MVLVLSEHDVSSVLNMADGIRLIEDAFKQHSDGHTLVIPRLNVNLPGSAGAFRVMPAAMTRASTFGLKTLTGYPGRRAPNETYFTLLLFDARDGALRAVMAGNHITGIRTGAATGVAAKYLARHDAVVLGIFGAGIQAFHQVAAVASVRPLQLVKVFDIDMKKTAAFVLRVEKELALAARPALDPKEVVVGSDLVITATTAQEPVFRGEWLEPGTHASGIGANAPSKRELDLETFRRSKVIVDFKDQVLEEAGDLRAAIQMGAMGTDIVHAELADILVGRKVGRENASEITLFKSVGVAIEDISVAGFVLEQALSRGIGSPVELSNDGLAFSRPGLPGRIGS